MNESPLLKLLNRILFVLAWMGIFIACHLLFAKLHSTNVGGCGTAHACDAVNNSPFAMIFGIPVSALGVAGYAVVTLLTFGRAVMVAEAGRRYLSKFLFVCVMIAMLFTVRLEFLMLFRIGICRWCMGSASIILAMSLLLLFERKVQRDMALKPNPDTGSDSTTRRRARLFERNLFLGIIGAGIFAILADKTYYEKQPVVKPLPSFTRIEPKIFDIRELDPPGSIGFGPRDAKVVVAEFYNYECSHCREVEPVMEGIRKKYGDKIRFVLHYFRIPTFPRGEFMASALFSGRRENPERAGALHEKLITVESLQQDKIDSLLSLSGLDPDQVMREFKEEKHKSLMDADQDLVKKVGVGGSPTVFVNHTRFTFPFKPALIVEEIDAALEGNNLSHLPGNSSSKVAEKPLPIPEKPSSTP